MGDADPPAGSPWGDEVISTDGRVVAVGAPPTFRHQVARALAVDPETVPWMPTVSAAESSLSEQRHAPNVLVLSPSIKELDAFGMAEFAGRSSPTSAVVMVRDFAPNGLLPAAMRAGVRDVIDMSKGGEELRDALQRALAWSENLRSANGAGTQESEESRGMVISVFSSKGGTGKTFLTSNLGAALARDTGKDTAILDLELEVGDVHSYFGRTATTPLSDLLAIGDMEDPNAIAQMGTRVRSNLWTFGTGSAPGAEPVPGEAMGKVVRTLRGVFPYVVVDATADYTDAALAAFDLSDSICLITGLDVVGVRHLSLALETLLSLGFPRERFRLVLNRADSKVGLSPADVERVMKVSIDTMIPSSRLVPNSLNSGIPVLFDQPKSEVSKAVATLARKFVPVPVGDGGRRGLFGKKK
jgi:pilus assembly protein CpaE